MMQVADPNNSSRSSTSATAATTTTEDSHSVVLSSFHSDYIYKVAFDTYGRRMATCSGDRFVRVWDLTDTGEWVLSAHWQAQRGSVTSLAWAHPEYGVLLATCGSDQDVKIWEERSSGGGGVATASTGNMAARWNLKASLTEARRAVTCLEFAPRHFGLKLAVGSADGCVRIYEAVDVSSSREVDRNADRYIIVTDHNINLLFVHPSDQQPCTVATRRHNSELCRI
jgi:WD40 repeat protein